MIAMTIKNGKAVRLSADHFVDTGTVVYSVYSCGYYFRFHDFKTAASVYKDLSRTLEEGASLTMHIKRVASAARMMGYTVDESSYGKEVK